MALPSTVTTGRKGEEVLVDLGNFVCYHSSATGWWVTADWGDGMTTRRYLQHDGGIGAWPHTFTEAGNYTVTVSIEDDWFQSAHHDFVVTIS
jgi:hypothetical protein